MIGFFLNRPVFASVCALFIVLAGLVSIPTLPVAQFPQVAPPVVTVAATYIGANAQAAESSVTTPLEEAINGVDGLRYISSTTTSDGTSTIACTFVLDRNIDLAANDVQNQVNNTIGRLPAEVRATGVTVTKNSGTFVLAMGLTADERALRPGLREQLCGAQHRRRAQAHPGRQRRAHLRRAALRHAALARPDPAQPRTT